MGGRRPAGETGCLPISDRPNYSAIARPVWFNVMILGEFA